MELRKKNEFRHYQATGEERLERLADFLDTLAPGKLTFSRWYGDGKGCAIGLAAIQDPWFRAQGLLLEHEHRLKDCRPVYDGRSDWHAVAAFFEIELEDVGEFFTERGYEGEMRPDPARVSGKIRTHLEAWRRIAARPRTLVPA